MFTTLLIPLANFYLSIVLGVAGAAKLARLGEFQETVAALGVPKPLRRFVAGAVPVLELFTAAGLWVPAAALWAGLMAALLFAGFAALGVWFSSREIRCNCFGALMDDTLGSTTVIRNLPLCLAAVLVALVPIPPGTLQAGDLPAWILTAAGLFLLGPISRVIWR